MKNGRCCIKLLHSREECLVTGFAALMLEEADVRKIVLDANDCKKHSIVFKKMKEHEKDI